MKIILTTIVMNQCRRTYGGGHNVPLADRVSRLDYDSNRPSATEHPALRSRGGAGSGPGSQM